MDQLLGKVIAEKDTNDHNMSQLSISTIKHNRNHILNKSIAGTGDPNKTINQCFEEAQRQKKDQLTHKINTFQKEQNLLQHKLQNYVKVLEKQLQRKNQINAELHLEIQKMKDDIKEIGTDVEILATVLSQQAKPKRKTTYHKVSESKFQSKIQYNNDEEKQREKQGGLRRREQDKKVPFTKRAMAKSTSGKKKVPISPSSKEKGINDFREKGMKRFIL